MKKNNTSENRIARKLRSEAGASITFALLLFLVCAALSAVILVAATTTSGRMSGLAEADQKYYSVMSAADLIADELDGHSFTEVTITQKNDKGETIGTPSKYAFNKHINEISDDVINRVAVVDPEYNDGTLPENAPEGDGDTGNAVNENIGEDAEERTYGSSGTPVSEEASLVSVVTGLLSADPSSQLTLKFSGSDKKEVGSLAVVISAVRRTDGTVDLYVTNNQEGPGKYKMLLNFGVEEISGNPPVTKIKNVDVTGHEYTWTLNKMMSAYDAGE